MKLFPTLVTAAEDLTGDELGFAPELSTLAALDASLLAATTVLKTGHPGPRRYYPSWDPRGINVDEHLAEAIIILAQALRSNLAAYYAAVQESCTGDEVQQEFQF